MAQSMSGRAGVAGLLHGRPSTSFALAALVMLVIALAALVLLAFVPRADFSFTQSADGQQVVLEGKSFGVFDTVVLADAQGANRLAMPAGQLADYWEPRGDQAERLRFYADRDRLARMISHPGTVMRLPDGSVRPVSATSGLRMPSPDVLVIGLSSLAGALIGLWLLSIRPAEEAARSFAVCGVLFCLNTVIMAGILTVNPAVPGRSVAWLLQANYLVGPLIALALIDLFGRYPLPLVPRSWLRLLWAVVPAVCLGLWLVGVDHLYTWYDGLVGVLVLVIIALVGWQVRASRDRPDIMAAFRWIGSTLLFATVCFFFLSFLPQLAGQPVRSAVAIVIPIFTLFFLSLGIAVTRYRLFDLGNWSTQIVRTALILTVVLVLDLTVAIFVGSTWTLSFALFLVALIWIPLREYALRRGERARGNENIVLLRHANRVAFSRTGGDQDAAWSSFLQAQFAPLTAAPAACETVTIDDSGKSMLVPSPLGHGGVMLSFAGKGTRLFNRADAAMAEAMVSLVREIAQARDAYDRGAETERRRIARDLHDDVGARLMTSLYQGEVGAMQTEVRQAMSEMRMVIDGLSGQRRSLEDSLADLRHETVSRLRLAGIGANWPLPDLPDAPLSIDHGPNRALHSVVRELVSNIIRHSGATQVQVDVTVHDRSLHLRVRDNGKGLASEGLPVRGNGFANMTKRLTDIGGQLTSEPVDQGCCFLVVIPPVSPELGMA